MSVINEVNVRLTPRIPEKKVLWHIIEQGVLSNNQRSSFAQGINNASIESKARERIWVVKRGRSITQTIDELQGLCPEEDLIFDVALSSPEHTARVPGQVNGEKIPMLIFQGKPGDLRQVEGIVAALRALHLDKDEVMPKLLQIYSILAESAFKDELPDIDTLYDSPKDFALRFIFDLPPAEPLLEDYENLNERLLAFLTSA